MRSEWTNGADSSIISVIEAFILLIYQIIKADVFCVSISISARTASNFKLSEVGQYYYWYR